MRRAIACCNIKQIYVLIDDENGGITNDDRLRRRQLAEMEEEGIEVLTLEQYRDLFGVEYDPEDWNPENFTQ